MSNKQRILLALPLLFLCLAGFIQAQPVMPTGVTSLECYGTPGYFVTARNTGQSVRMILNGNATTAGQFTIVPALTGTVGNVSFLSASLANNYMRHSNHILQYSTITDTLGQADGSWTPVPGLADPTNPRLVSFKSENFGFENRHLMADVGTGNRSLRSTPITATMTPEELARATFMFPDPTLPSNAKPGNKTTEISIDVGAISWNAGSTAITHNVFWGTDANSVRNATIADPLGTTVYQNLALDNNSIDLNRLAYGTTYYWKVVETTSTTPVTGDTWNFKTELQSYPLAKANFIGVTTGGTPAYDNQEPNSTYNGKGLDANDRHSTDPLGMWLAQPDENTGAAPWIQYEFDKVYKVYDMKVWNYNEESPTEGFGVKDANISYSIDGVVWTNMPTVQFNIATGDNTCTGNTIVGLNSAAAKFVRITFLTSFEGSDIYGISEVRFSTEPTRAVQNSPANNATNQVINAALNWKAGRYFDKHYLYISSDINDVNVVSPLVAPIILTDPTYVTSLDLNTKYYWRVDEVNMANAYTTWDGSMRNFTTAQFLLVDGFEVGYGNTDSNAVWATWIDGYNNSAVNGALIGSGITAPGLSTTAYSGSRSAPVTYDNTGTAAYSEVTAQSVKLPIGTTDWTKGSPTALVIWFSGAGTNTPDQMYVKLNNTKILYTGDPSGLTQSVWRPFVIDLTSLNHGNITSITIGLQKTGQGGKGTILIDGIALYAAGSTPPLPAEPVNPGNTGLVASYSMENNVNDGSGHALNGTIVGTPAYAQGMTGRGMAMQFNGTTDCIDLGNKAEFNPAGSFSVSLWANITTWTSQWGNVMVANRGEGTVGWQLRRYSNSNFSFTTRGISNDDMNSNGNPPLSEWINITCVYDSVARTKAIYFDGVLNRTVNMTGTVIQIPATTHNTYIGARANSDNSGQEGQFAGLIDEVRIYDRALSAGEVVYLSDPTP